MRPRIAITMGDPAGIGPEVVLKALADPTTSALARWRLVADDSVLERTVDALGLPWPPALEVINDHTVFCYKYTDEVS